jgi:sugar O-acyltransferase (sialic acid O-acetyltransferase NeuD family)
MFFAIYGVGGFGREIAPLAQDLVAAWRAEQKSSDWGARPAVVFVDDAENRASICNGIPVIGFDDLQKSDHRNRAIIVAIGEGRTREKVEKRCEAAGLSIGKLVAPTTRILANNEIAAGAVLCDFVIITANARIGKSFQGNIYSYVAHDCVIGDYVTFAPGVCCNGNIHIGDYAYIGTGAVFTQGKVGQPLTIGEGAIVGMGAVVTKSVEPYTVVTGNPARPIRTLERPA